jgi:putative CocE/NonD family hydrolase
MRRLSLAVVVLGLTLSAPAVAATPDLTPGPDDYPAIATEPNVPILMSDGVTLRATVRRPATADGKPAPGKFPAVLTQTPYNKVVLAGGDAVATLAGAPTLLIKHGYVAVTVDVRGTGNSEGSWDSFGPREQKDGLELSQWLVKQAWSDGSFGLYGASYMGINQFLTAAQDPPGLKAMFPIIPASDLYRDVTWHGGSVDAGFIPLWIGLVTALGFLPADDLQTDPVETLKVLLDRITTGTNFQTTSISSLVTQGDLAFDGDFYKERSPENVIDKIKVPTFITGGWWDLFQRGEPRLYNELKLPPGQKQLLMGPWYHVTAGDGLGAAGAPPAMPNLALAWFDRWIKGKPNHIEDFGPVTLNELGSGRWVTQPSYPGPVSSRRLYLRAGKGLADTPPTAAATDTVLANPINGLCNRQTVQWTAGIVPSNPCVSDERLYEASGLTYTTPRLQQDLRLIGPLALTLHASTTAADTTWIATLADVAPDGKSTPLTSGWLMPSRRAIDESRSVRTAQGDLIVPFHPFTRNSVQPVTPGKPETLNVELFGTNAVFAAGHRLRVVLTHGDIPHLLATLPDTLNELGAVDSVHLDPANPSFLTFGELTSSDLAAPPAHSCVSRRAFTIRLEAPRRGVAIRRASVAVAGKAARVTRGKDGWVAEVDLRGKPRARVSVAISVTGSDGRVYHAKRSYRTCSKRR